MTYNLILKVEEVERQECCFCGHHRHFVVGLPPQVTADQGQELPNVLPHAVHKTNVDGIGYGRVLKMQGQ